MARTPIPHAVPVTIRHRWRFAVVLVASLLLAVAQPLTSGLFGDQGSFDIFFSLLIVAVLLLVFEEKEHRRIAILVRAGRLSRHLGKPRVRRRDGPIRTSRSTFACRMCFCVCFVWDSPCNLCETGVR